MVIEVNVVGVKRILCEIGPVGDEIVVHCAECVADICPWSRSVTGDRCVDNDFAPDGAAVTIRECPAVTIREYRAVTIREYPERIIAISPGSRSAPGVYRKKENFDPEGVVAREAPGYICDPFGVDGVLIGHA